MSSAGGDRTVVKTYVPRFQKEIWTDEADELSMSQSEYLRSMVQAGRREIICGDTEETDDSPATPRGEGLETRVYEVIRDEGPLEWDALVEKLFEDRLEAALHDLQRSNRIHHAPRKGGYVTTDG